MPADVILRLLEQRDINLLRELRNANRQHFFNTRVITKEQQEKWWCDYQGDSEFVMYVIQVGPTPVGFISVKPLKSVKSWGVCEVGNLIMAPAYRGQGIMTQALCQLRRHWYDCFWVAYVKDGNDASLRLFEKAGFWRVK